MCRSCKGLWVVVAMVVECSRVRVCMYGSENVKVCGVNSQAEPLNDS